MIRDERPLPSPYPGLRPFQLEDSEYFFGRDEQAQQITARLRQSRFLSVLGGSGSGKSSLVLAGAIPRLRSFAILEAGDFWVPVVSTPGTNHVGGDSPIERLAQNFCLQLADIPNSEQLKSRVAKCAEILRQPDGLRLLVELFGKDLKNTDGVDIRRGEIQVNFLFLIDQFEEIFHSSNIKPPIADDCAHLVNRILEHFNTHHPQVCVALTMRSEHLNDCPRYPNLPDAINATFYLVKRLNKDQLRKAIVQPAQHYLRNAIAQERQRARVEGKSAPQSWQGPGGITIGSELVDRLLSDSDKVLAQQDHADQLPLLQHLLFWIWFVAMNRGTSKSHIPTELTLTDLWAAVYPEINQDVSPLKDDINVLTTCLEKRCEAIFKRHMNQQSRWKRIFTDLAYREPNTGTYTQQRAEIASLSKILNATHDTKIDLVENLSPWLNPHPYLYWDKDSGTVKVAHETLIRRWKQFRDWIDYQDRQLQLYIRLLDECISVGNKPASFRDRLLLTGESLSRYRSAGLLEALEDPAQCTRLEKLLSLHRDGARLSPISGDAKEFLKISVISEEQRRTEEISKEKAKSRKRVLASLALILTISLGIFAFSQTTLKTQAALFFVSYTLPRETQNNLRKEYYTLDEMRMALSNSLAAGLILDAGKAIDTGLIEFVPGYKSLLQHQEHDKNSGESSNIAALSAVLRTSPWEMNTETASETSSPPTCTLYIPNRKPGKVPFFKAGDQYPGRGLVVTQDKTRTAIFSATIKDESNKDESKNLPSCHTDEKEIIYEAPNFTMPRIGIDNERASLVIVEFPEVVSFFSIVWEANSTPKWLPYSTIFRKSNKQSVAPNNISFFFPIVTIQQPEALATDIRAGSFKFRVFAREPLPLQIKTDYKPDERMLFKKVLDTDLCHEFLHSLNPKTGTDDATAFQLSSPQPNEEIYCLHQTVVTDPSTNSKEYFASLYSINENTPIPYIRRRLPLATGIPLGKLKPNEYMVISNTGWLAYKNQANQWFTTPWKLDHWKTLACGVFRKELDDKIPQETKKIFDYKHLIDSDEILKTGRLEPCR